MILIGKQILHDFKEKHADARLQVEAWEFEVGKAVWKMPHDLKARYPKVSLLGNQNAIFDICNNKYRLWVKITYKNGIVLLKEVGTHKEYDKWIIS